MKKIIYLISLIMLISVVSAGLIGDTPIPQSVYLDVTLISQEPDPVEPGSTADIRFKLENRGSWNAQDVEVELVTQFPFSAYGDDSTQQVGSIYGRQLGDKGVIVKFTVKVDESAAAGENPVILRYREKNGPWIELSEFNINIEAQDAILMVDSIEINDTVAPGEIFDLKVKLNNLADFAIKDIQVKLDLDGVPLAPIQSTNERNIELMQSNGVNFVNFKLMVEAEAAAKVYKVPLELKYLDPLGTNYYKNSTIGIVVGDTPNLLVSVDSTTVHTAGKKGDVIIRFVNRGLSDVKFVIVKLLPSDEFELLSADTVYIGTIDSDDYETADFSIFIKKRKGDTTLPIEIEYKDSTNKDYTTSYDLDLKLYSKTQAKKMGVNGGSNIGAVLITILIVGLIFWLYKKKKWPFRKH